MPVEGGLPILSFKDKVFRAIYGVAPRFALLRRAHHTRGTRCPPGSRIPGIECVEVLHADVTALDFCPSLTSDRLAIETCRATTRWFATRHEAEEYYDTRRDLRPTAALGRTPEHRPAQPRDVPSALGLTQNAGRQPPTQRDIGDGTYSPLMDGPLTVEFEAKPQPSFFDSLPRYHENTMIVVFSQDPNFTSVMRELLQPTYSAHERKPTSLLAPFTENEKSQRRLLALYEAGIPSWAVFFCRWGLPYRRWFRIAAVTMLNIWPFIALVVGLYDLYKHMPYVREWLEPVADWMDAHFTLRVSVAVAYLFTLVIQALDSIFRFVKGFLAIVGFLVSPLYPLWEVFSLLRGPALSTLAVFVVVAKSTGTVVVLLWNLLASTFMLPYYLGQLMMGVVYAKQAAEPVRATVASASYTLLMWRSTLRFWQEVARPVKNLLKAIYDGIVHVGTQAVRREASLRLWYTAKYREMKEPCERMFRAAEEEVHSPTWRSVVFFAVLAVLIAAGLHFGWL
jgi:hypothetical protein